MNKDITHFVTSCLKCQTRKAAAIRNPGYLQPLVVDDLFDKVGIDVLGPFVKAHGKEYIIVAIDYYSKWVEAQATSSFSAQVTAKFLITNIFCRYGAPKTLLSDQGTNFTSKVVKEVNRHT